MGYFKMNRSYAPGSRADPARLLTCLQSPWQTAMKIDCPIQEDPCFLHYLLFQKNTSHKATLFSQPNQGENHSQGLTCYLKALGQVRNGKSELSVSSVLWRQNGAESQELWVPLLATPLSPQSLSPVRRRGWRGRALSHKSCPFACLAESIQVDWLFVRWWSALRSQKPTSLQHPRSPCSLQLPFLNWDAIRPLTSSHLGTSGRLIREICNMLGSPWRKILHKSKVLLFLSGVMLITSL